MGFHKLGMFSVMMCNFSFKKEFTLNIGTSNLVSISYWEPYHETLGRHGRELRLAVMVHGRGLESTIQYINYT